MSKYDNLSELADAIGISPIELGDMLSYIRMHAFLGETDEFEALRGRLSRIERMAVPTKRQVFAAELCGPYANIAIRLIESASIFQQMQSRRTPFPFQKIINVFNPTR
jgi:hypothetical protein